MEKLSPPDRLSKFCIDAGFLNVVEIGHYFITKDCRILTNHRCSGFVVSTRCKDTKIYLNQKVGSKGTPKLDQYWKLQRVACTACKYGVEIRIMSMKKDNSSLLGQNFSGLKKSWSRIWTTTSRKFQKFSSKKMRVNWMRRIFACWSKAKRTTTKKRNLLICQASFRWMKGIGLILNQENHSLSLCARGFEESNPSSSTFSNSTTRRRVHCPEERSKAKVVGNYQYTSALRWRTIETVFRTSIPVNQLSIYGAVSDLCEEHKACHVRTGETCYGRKIWPIVCSSKFVDENT